MIGSTANAQRRFTLQPLRILAIDALIAGGLGSLVETLRIAKDTHDVGLDGWIVIVGLAISGATLLSLLVQLALTLVLTIPSIAAVVRDFANNEDRRVTIVWRSLLVVCALLVFGLAAFGIASGLHARFRFQESNILGALVASMLAPVALATVVVTLLVDRRVAPTVSRFRGILVGRRSWAVAPIACIIGVMTPTVLAGHVVPEANIEPVTIMSAIIVFAVATRLVSAGRRRTLCIAAPILVFVSIAGFILIGQAQHARAAIVTYGAVSKGALKLMWRVADGDHDGYAPPWIGGADCDDSDPRRSPARREVPDNGIDENCTGRDATSRVGQREAASNGRQNARRQNVVLISLDAVRADHIGSWGYKRSLSPSIDALAQQGTRFEVALTSSPSTRYAIPSLMSGRFASTISGTRHETTLAEALQAAGYQTAAVLCCQSIVKRGELRGFDEIDTGPETVRLARTGQSNADAVAVAAIDRLERQARHADGRPLFLWVHFYDAHHPYWAPKRTSLYGRSDLDRYDAEIAFLDENIGQLLRALDTSNLAEDTIVVLTSDHGEEFGEHGIRFHARSLYNQVIRVPLLIRAPRAGARVISQPVSIVDVMPTILDLVGAAVPATNGRSLASAVLGYDRGPSRPVLVELVAESWYKRDGVAVVNSEWKVIWDREANSWSLYATSDNDDRDDRVASAPEQLEEMKNLLWETLDRELQLPSPR